MKRRFLWILPVLVAIALSGCASTAWRSGGSSGYISGFSSDTSREAPRVYGQINSSYTHRID
ncbi:hypothetical protein [Halothiobacillus sp. 15-55-196]|uniref:hypothetical protein n=1 Tax=Halothiobacillus sp. 15-55-196 TaxID=1970382 RepID=UPI0025BB449E|nr:hypothetical protein [Halothiobacillus sp. 15-55-196]